MQAEKVGQTEKISKKNLAIEKKKEETVKQQIKSIQTVFEKIPVPEVTHSNEGYVEGTAIADEGKR